MENCFKKQAIIDPSAGFMDNTKWRFLMYAHENFVTTKRKSVRILVAWFRGRTNLQFQLDTNGVYTIIYIGS